MTEDQRKKYEEAANKLFPFFDKPAFNQYMQAKREAFVGGCEFASQDTEERVKQAHNGAIDSISKLIREKSFSFTEEEIQKLKL